MEVAGREIVFTGCERAKGRFLTTAIRAARRKAPKGKEKIKLVVAGHPNLAPVARAMRLTTRGLKSIICTHGVEVWEPLTRMRRYALRRANLVLAPSKYTADHVCAVQGVAPGRIRVLPWALDPQFEALAPNAGKTPTPANFPEGRVVLTVGRWRADERYKGMDTLITALPRLLSRWPEVELVAVGEGDDRQWLEDLAEENGVDRHVHFLSGLSYEQLASCYGHCEIFALPSKGEGFGLVYLEGMRMGRPCLVSDCDAGREVVNPPEAGLAVNPDNLEQVADAVQRMLTPGAEWDDWSSRARARCETRFTADHFRQRLISALFDE